jgi:hypothetical protein
VTHRLDGAGDRALARDDDDLAVDARLSHLRKQLEAIHLRHLQVGQHEAELAGGHLVPGFAAVRGGVDVVALFGEEHLQTFGDVPLIIGDEHFR